MLTHLSRSCPLNNVPMRLSTASDTAPKDSALQPPVDSHPRGTEYNTAPSQDPSFSQRVDRHGRPFGERVPCRLLEVDPWPTRSFQISRQLLPGATSTDSTPHEKEFALQSSQRPRPSLPREVTATENHHTPPQGALLPSTSGGSHQPLQRNLALCDYPAPVNGIPSKEAVLGELKELSHQYVNVADPTESAARRQRVLQSEQNGLVEETAEGIIAAATRAIILSDTEVFPALEPEAVSPAPLPTPAELRISIDTPFAPSIDYSIMISIDALLVKLYARAE
ncbi:hypothetical protein F2Q69_00027039 [Brassica cretica]|uniref:Uncharacterized protein n=1 Tax=Brassica cretica TaxID=69181 RepID=A0A8S9S8K3_BRACR|nr:hypothetical protein F2Q69_00027039 [Brassica cretica]